MTAKAKWASLFIAIAIVALLFILPETFWNEVFDKLFVDDNSGKTNLSTQTRYDAIYYMLKELVNSFGIGVGIGKFTVIQEKYCNNMATATMVNWISIYGLIWGAINILGYLKFF